MTRHLILDYETFSEIEIKKAGAFEYSMHPSTEILCCAFRIGTKKELPNAHTYLWVPGESSEDFSVLISALSDPSLSLVAHNALFEQVITRNVLGKKYMYSRKELQEIPVSRWTCTASLSRSIGLPGNLEGAGAALGLAHQKDKEGHRLMLKLTKPKRPSKKDPSTRHSNPEDYKRLAQYCKRDIAAEVDLFMKLPSLPPKERQIWLLNQEMNLGGFKVDRKLVKGALKLIDIETNKMDGEVKAITKGRVTSARQRDEFLYYLLRHEGMELPNLQAGTVQHALEQKKYTSENSKRLLEIRNSTSKSSTAKYKAFEIRSRSDGRARDNTIFFGAHTGREAGTGLQPQNLFKTVLSREDLEAGLKLIRNGDVHAIQSIYERPMDLYASALRSCIIADDGCTLDVGDFATIEVRVLFWLCGNQRGLDALASGKDLYVEMAGKIFKISQDAVTKTQRQLGKTVVLGAGFGIGWKKFLQSCKQQKLEVSEALARSAVEAYRDTHKRVTIFWSNIEKAAIKAVQNPTKKYRLGYLTWEKSHDFLTVTLPIGRKLHYYKPKIIMKKTPWDQFKPCLTYLTQNSVTKKFERQESWGGVLTENVVQAVARDLLKEALLRIKADGKRQIILEVHDEIVCERPKTVSNTEEFIKLMQQVPEWCPGLPIKVEAWSEPRYRK